MGAESGSKSLPGHGDEELVLLARGEVHRRRLEDVERRPQERCQCVRSYGRCAHDQVDQTRGGAASSCHASCRHACQIARMAETAKKKNREVQIVSTAEASQFALAQQRANLVRQTLEQGGVPLARMTIKISQVPQGTVSATEANRVAMVLQ